MKFPLMSRIFLFLSAVLFVVSLFVRLIFYSWDSASLFYFISSLACLAISVALDWRSYFDIFRLRFTRKSIHASRPFLITLVVLVVLNYLAVLFPMKLDYSSERLHTLSPFSKKVAKGFTDTVEFVYLYVPDNESRETEINVHSALRRYQDENSHIKYSKYNIVQHPEMAQKFSLNSQEQALFAVHKEHKERFYKTDENSITQALLRLSKGRKTIYFSVGHGEASLSETKGMGLASLKKEVERLFYDTQEINLNNEILPENASALIVMAPEKELTVKSQEKILEFFSKGGRIFIGFDPLHSTNVSPFLEKLGLKMLPGVVHMDENALAAAGTHLVSGLVKDPTNPLMEGLGNESVVLFYVTGALVPVPNDSLVVTPLIVSPESAVLRSGFTKTDKLLQKGPFDLLVEVQDKGNEGRAFVTMDGDLFSNQFIYQHLNPTLMFNLFSSLTKDEDVITSTPPVKAVSSDFLVTETQYKMYIGLFILPLPILLFAMAGFVWFRRRWL